MYVYMHVHCVYTRSDSNSLMHHHISCHYFHRSLQYVDLRLCYSNNITRTVLEADMSYFNGYQVGVTYVCCYGNPFIITSF